MYGKIFSSIYDGTLVEDWRALITFQQFIILSDADGVVDMTPSAISRRTGIPVEHIKAGIEILEKDDKYSRTMTQKGRRIELLDAHRPWGWYIVNHEKYKQIQDSETIRNQNRERKQRQREREKDMSHDVTVSHACHAKSRHIDTDIDTNIKTKERGNKNFSPPSLSEVTSYCLHKEKNIDPESFINFYESKGWMIGKNKMKNWKACIATWEKRENKTKQENYGDGGI